MINWNITDDDARLIFACEDIARELGITIKEATC